MLFIRNAQDAFHRAIWAGRLSVYKGDAHFAGNYLYIGTTETGDDLFTHHLTGESLRHVRMPLEKERFDS